MLFNSFLKISQFGNKKNARISLTANLAFAIKLKWMINESMSFSSY